MPFDRRHPIAALVLLIGMIVIGAGLSPAAAGIPNDPGFSQQWGLSLVGAPQAWSTSTGQGVLIGVVDTGVDLAHQDLAGKIAGSTNCIGSNGAESGCHGNGQDDYGHGTHVSGIAAADTGNGLGVAGMAPGARLLVAKALDSTGRGSTADINAGIHWVVDHGARIVNLSLGDPDFVFTSVFGSSLADGIEYAWSKGAIPVLAAGNSNTLGLGSSNYGSLDAVVVGAVGRNDAIASYSSPTGNAKWSLLAPGGSDDGTAGDDVLSTYWISGKSNQYAYLAGTSMATPTVAGALALLLSSGLGPQAAISRLLGTVDTKVSCGSGSPTCHGRLDVGAAVGAHVAPPPPTISQPPPGAASQSSGAGPSSTAGQVRPPSSGGVGGPSTGPAQAGAVPASSPPSSSPSSTQPAGSPRATPPLAIHVSAPSGDSHPTPADLPELAIVAALLLMAAAGAAVAVRRGR